MTRLNPGHLRLKNGYVLGTGPDTLTHAFFSTYEDFRLRSHRLHTGRRMQCSSRTQGPVGSRSGATGSDRQKLPKLRRGLRISSFGAQAFTSSSVLSVPSVF